MINVYPSKLEGMPIETHEIKKPCTVEQWLFDNIKGYESREIPPISISVNGELIPPGKWSEANINRQDTVNICIEPHGIETAIIISVVIAVASVVYAMIMMGNMPKMPNSGAPTRGDNLDEANAKGNRVKLNSIIREIAGTFKVYPDYLLPPHYYFVNQTEQWVEMLLCVGKGYYTIPDENVLIGDTQISSLGLNAEYQIYEPGADLSGDNAAKWWHYAPEISSTSTGKSGLELNATYVLGDVANANSYSFDKFNISIPAGAGYFPNWPVDTILTIEYFQNFEVIEGWSDRDIISGDFSSLNPFEGMPIEITGPNEGDYVIHSYELDSDGIGHITLDYDNGSQVNGLLTGTQRMSIGYRKQRYKITGRYRDSETLQITGIDVVRLTDTGDVDIGWPGFSFAIINDAVIAVDASDLEGEWAGPFAACPEGETTDTLEYDLLFPQGLGYVNSSGAIYYVNVTTELQWREIGTAEWNVVLRVFTNNNLDQQGYTETVNLGSSIRPEVRMRRIGAKYKKTNIQDSVQWYALKARLTAPSSYAGVTTMTARIKGGDNISAQSDRLISVKASRKLPTRSGGEWTELTETRSISAWVCYVAKSMGYTDDDLSLIDFDSLDTLWNSRGDFYDMAVESEGTVKGEMLNALRAGFAEFTLDRGVIKPVRDQVRTIYEHMYTPQNMTEQLTRSFQTLRPDEFDGVDVEYISSTTWAKETVQCRLPGDIGSKVEKITLEGVTDRTKAWRIGMRQRRMQKYRRWSYRFSTELDALNSSYLSFCAVGDDVPGYSQSAILTGFSPVSGGYLLQSSEPFEWTENETHVIGIRKPDGTLSGPYTATRVSDKTLTITEIDFTPDTSWDIEPPHLIFGTLNRWSYPVLISSISHNGESKVNVEAVNYDARIYEDDDNSP